jgi:hypothetical protein
MLMNSLVVFQLFVASCRALGLATRLVYSLQPISFKPSDLVSSKYHQLNLLRAYLSEVKLCAAAEVSSDAAAGHERLAHCHCQQCSSVAPASVAAIAVCTISFAYFHCTAGVCVYA